MSFPPGLVAAVPLSPPPPFDRGIEAVSAPYWRVRMPWLNASGVNLTEIEMRAVEGGPDQCEGGTATASNGSSSVSNLFDGTNAGIIFSNVSSAWVQYQFPAPVQVVELVVKCDNSYQYSPRVVTLEYSDDGATWSVWAIWNGLTTWTAYETKIFNAANRLIIPPGTSPHWRLHITANNYISGVTNYLEINELEFRATPGGPSLPPTMAGRPLSLAGTSGFSGATNAFDGLYNSDSALTSSGPDRLPAWLGYMFPEPVSVVEAAIRSDTSPAYMPKDFTFEYSNDYGLTWMVVHASTSQIAWGTFEVRIFDLTTPTSSGIRGDWHLDVTRKPSGWGFFNYVEAAENVSAGDNRPGFVLSNKSLGAIPRYFEVRIDARGSGTSFGYVGIVEDSRRLYHASGQIPDQVNNWGYRENGEIRKSTGIVETGASYGAGDTVMVAYNPVANTVQFGKNGVWHPTTFPVAAGFTHYAAFGLRDQGDRSTLIGRAADMLYGPPSGYSDLAA